MDLNEFLATLWFYLYPVLLVSSIVLCIVGALKRRLSKPLYLFSCIFLTGVVLGYAYYLINLYSGSSEASFLAATRSFYFWFYFIALWLFVIGFVLTVLYKVFLKSPRS
jgi:hypothetical protein